MKKIGGIALLVFAVLLTIVTLVSLSSLLSNLVNIRLVFDPEVTEFEKGQVIGGLVYWVIHFIVLFLAFKYGRRWSKVKRSV